MTKPKFNFIDGLVILFIVAAIALGVYLLAGNSATTGETGGVQNITAEYRVEFTQSEPEVYESFLKALENGESVWVGEKERFEGKIMDVTYTPATKVITNYQTGEATLAEYPDLYDITVLLQSAAVETNDSITASGTAIRVGNEVAVKGKGFAGYGFVVDLRTF